jgi:transglutaminase-like putative cysteine protease
MAKKIHDEILNESINSNDEEKGEKSNFIFKFFLALILIFLMILFIIPHYTLKYDEEPRNIPSKDEIYGQFYNSLSTEDITRPESNDIRRYVDYLSPEIKLSSTKIASLSCQSEKICQAKAIYYFVRDNFNYVSETDEYYQTPKEMILSNGGDCDDFSILLASKMKAIGIPVRFVFVPRHVYIQIYVEDAKKKYLDDGWINLDATCTNCKFGEIPKTYKNQQKKFLFI